MLMKSLQTLTLAIVLFGFIGLESSVEARDNTNLKKYGNRQNDSSVKYRQSAPESAETYSNDKSFALGYSTIALPFQDGFGSITGLCKWDRLDAIQTFLTIPRTSPFNIAASVLYKRTVLESEGAGFHLGGGLGLGSANGGTGGNFIMNMSAIAGFHFPVPGASQIMVHIDGGPNFTLYNIGSGAASTTQTNFQMTPLSPALGLSIVYIL